MSGKFSLDDYVDVAERIAQFKDTFPDGSLQGSGDFVRLERPGDDVTGNIIGFLYTARAYRTPDDKRPGVGTAFEPIPGKTPYTKDSEVQNAETAAWGRAIVALGFATKKIASKQEVKARQSSAPGPRAGGSDGEKPSPGADDKPNPKSLAEVDTLVTELAAIREVDRKVVISTLDAEMGADWRDSDVKLLLARAKLRGWAVKAGAKVA